VTVAARASDHPVDALLRDGLAMLVGRGQDFPKPAERSGDETAAEAAVSRVEIRGIEPCADEPTTP
jgi:hypothetical protein